MSPWANGHYTQIRSWRSERKRMVRISLFVPLSSISSGMGKRTRSIRASGEPDSNASPKMESLVAIHAAASVSHVRLTTYSGISTSFPQSNIAFSLYPRQIQRPASTAQRGAFAPVGKALEHCNCFKNLVKCISGIRFTGTRRGGCGIFMTSIKRQARERERIHDRVTGVYIFGDIRAYARRKEAPWNCWFLSRKS